MILYFQQLLCISNNEGSVVHEGVVTLGIVMLALVCSYANINLHNTLVVPFFLAPSAKDFVLYSV